MGLATSSRALRLPRLVKNANPRSSNSLSSTMRSDGAPSRPAVASPIASGCGTPAASASAYQRANWSSGSGARSAFRSGERWSVGTSPSLAPSPVSSHEFP